ncbi:MAG: serine hydrolase domain-containing protein [Gallionella sp.]|jgi:CubicO group peptidase (beta-lactamase class C family)
MRSLRVARFLRFVLSIAFSATAFCAVAGTPAANVPLELTTSNLASVLDPLMAEWINKHKGPGAVVVVVKRDGPVFAKGYGYADIEAKKPFTADATLVRPGSISKLFTGIAVMQLVDEGKLDLDRDVNAYLDFPVPTPEGGVPVTLRRLLTHRAGFEEHMKGVFLKDREPEALGRWLAKNMPRRLFPKGDIPAYSNYGVALAGYIVERVSNEPYAKYIQRHILDPLAMSHSTFRQPLPDTLAPLMAKDYRTSDKPSLGFFDVIAGSPAGALSATGTDMGRFIRALMNGGALDGTRILSRARLDEMMTPSTATPGDFIGLVFVGTKVAGHDSIGHTGGMVTFMSDLEFFPDQGVGVFVSLDGLGEINEPEELPDPARAIAERFFPKAPNNIDMHSALPGNAEMAGIYHESRRADSSFIRFIDLISQFVITVDNSGNAKTASATWPFDDGKTLKRLGQNLYEFPEGMRFTFTGDGADSYFSGPVMHMQRVPWQLDARWIAPALAASTALVFLTLLAWPVAALSRRWRKKPLRMDRSDRRKYLAARFVLFIDAVVISAYLALRMAGEGDPTVLNDSLNPLLLALYALAWLGAVGTIPVLWIATQFLRNDAGSLWARIHHALIAASTVVIAYFFITFHIAGTTLNY